MGTPFYRTLTARLLAIPIGVVILGLCIPVVVVYRLLVRSAERETHEKAVGLLRTYDALFAVTHDQIGAPKGAARIGASAIANSSLNREVMRRYSQAPAELNYQYRLVSLQPTSAADRADAFEGKMLAAFGADPRLNQIEDRAVRSGGAFLAVATPVRVDAEACLRCHTSPATAPPERLRAGGGGFGWKRGDVVAASIIYVPIDDATRQATRIF